MLEVKLTLDLGDQRYTTHVTRLRLTRACLPDVDRLQVDLPARVALDAAPGDDVALALDGGEGEHHVFRGTVQRIVASAHQVRVVAGGAGLQLGAARPALALEGTGVGQVVQQLCDDAGVATDVLDDGPDLALYLADGRATALQEIARLASLFGAHARIDGEGRLAMGKALGEARGLRYGREPIALHSSSGAPPAVEVLATGPFSAAPDQEGARWPVADFARGSDPASTFAWRRSLPGLGDVQAARAAAAALSERRAASWQPFHLQLWLGPAWAPLDQLSLQDAPERVALAEALVTHVIHTLDGSGARTELRGFSAAAAGGLGGLL